MAQILTRIQAAIRQGRFDFSMKARLEMQGDELSEQQVAESILNARMIYKTLRSTSDLIRERREQLHVIVGPDSNGTVVYTKGKLTKYGSTETYYFLVSAKLSI